MFSRSIVRSFKASTTPMGGGYTFNVNKTQSFLGSFGAAFFFLGVTMGSLEYAQHKAGFPSIMFTPAGSTIKNGITMSKSSTDFPDRHPGGYEGAEEE